MAVADAVTPAPGTTSGEHRAPARSRRHAWAALVYVTLLLLVAYRDGSRTRLFRTEDSFHLLMPFFFWTVAVVAWGVRMGRLRVDSSGVRWGFSWVGFRMRPERISVVRVYRDAAAIYSQRGPTPWTLLARDWERWDDVVRAFGRLNVPVERLDRKAPFFARLQGYGRALDLLLVLNSLAATLVVFSG
jgi:hypothetical protein